MGAGFPYALLPDGMIEVAWLWLRCSERFFFNILEQLQCYVSPSAN